MTDHQIARLFERRDRLERELVLVNARLSASRRDYSSRHGLLAYPSFDTMRKAVAS